VIKEEEQPKITRRPKESFTAGMMTQWWFKNSAYHDPSVIDPDFDTWVWGESPIDPTFCEEPYRGSIHHISGPSSVNGLIPRTPFDLPAYRRDRLEYEKRLEKIRSSRDRQRQAQELAERIEEMKRGGM
jgi:hypothetical protein